MSDTRTSAAATATQTLTDKVNAWITEWQTNLEKQCPDPMDRLLFLAFRCSSEHCWQWQRSSLADWDKAKQEVSVLYKPKREQLEREQGNGDYVSFDTPLWWSIYSQIQNDPAIKKAERKEEYGHRLFLQAGFDSGELYFLLWKHRPALLEYFGPPVRLDESYTPSLRAQWCSVVLAKLAADSPGGANGSGGNRKRRAGKLPLDKSTNQRDKLKFQVYERIQKERNAGLRPAKILDELKAEKDFMAQVKGAGLMLNKQLIKAAFAYFLQPKRKKKESEAN